MNSMARRLTSCLAVGAFAIFFSVGSSTAQDKKDDKKKTPAIKAVMKAMNGDKGLVAKTAKAAADGKWEDAVKTGKEAKEYGEALGKNKLKKGDEESWKAHTKTYAETATALYDGADAKDADAVKKAATTFKGACMACHKEHK